MNKRKGEEQDRNTDKKIKNGNNVLTINNITKEESEEEIILDFDNISAIMKVELVI